MMVEVLLTVAILSFSLAGIFAFVSSLLNSSRQTVEWVQDTLQYPIVYSCYAPLIRGVADDTQDTKQTFEIYQISHEPSSVLKDSDNVCLVVEKVKNEKNMLIYCFGNQNDKNE